MITVALRYSANISRDFRRGYSFAEWGLTAYDTRAECQADWPNAEIRYSRELRGFLPAHNGLCAGACECGETFEEALAEALGGMRIVDGMEEASVPLYAFPCRLVGYDPAGWPLVRPTGRARRVTRR